MNAQRGSALITVILVILVLTMVGLSIMLYMSIEDTISGNDRFQKEATYLAEVGLREGEAKMATTGVAQITTLLQYSDANNQVPPTLDQCTGVQYLGTVLTDASNSPLYNKTIAYNVTSSNTGGDRTGYYSVYVRNNKTDTAGSPTIDQDGFVDIIAVGNVKDTSGRITYQKILAEEFFLGSANNASLGPQIGGSSASTNAQSF